MKKALLATLLLAGCYTGAGDLIRETQSTVHLVKTAPREAAYCVLANMRRHEMGVTPRIIEIAGGRYDVEVREILFAGVVAYAVVVPAPGGAEITLNSALRLTQPEQLVDGC